MGTKKVLEWCLKKENINFTSVRQWLHSDKMDSLILSVVSDAISGNDDDAYRIVKMCLKMTNDGGMWLSCFPK